MIDEFDRFYSEMLSIPFTSSRMRQFCDKFHDVPLDLYIRTAQKTLEDGDRISVSKIILLGIRKKIRWDKNLGFKLYEVAENKVYCCLFDGYEEDAIDILFELIRNREGLSILKIAIAHQILAYYIVKFGINEIFKNEIIKLIKNDAEIIKEYDVLAYIMFINAVNYLKSQNIISNSDYNFKIFPETPEISSLLLNIEDYLTKDNIFKLLPTHEVISTDSGPIMRNNSKISRNDFCPCGSGKKYKKCCLSMKENNSIHVNYSQHIDLNRVEKLDAYQISKLDLKSLDRYQLRIAFRKSLDSNCFDLAYQILVIMREFYVESNGKIMESSLNYEDTYDYYISDAVFDLEQQNRYDLIEKFGSLCFEEEENKADVQYAKYITEGDRANILDLIEKQAFLGISDALITCELFYTINKHFPGIAYHMYRSIIASNPERTLDITTMMEQIETMILRDKIPLDSEPTIDKYYENLCNNQIDGQGTTKKFEELKKMQDENKDARKEIEQQNILISDLSKKLEAMKASVQVVPQIDPSPKVLTVQNIKYDDAHIREMQDQIANSQKKISQFKNIISEKQQSIKELYNTMINKDDNKSKDSERTSKILHINEHSSKENIENKDISEDVYTKDFNYNILHSKKVLVPQFDKSFVDGLLKVPDDISKKAILAMTDFTLGDISVLQQAKALKSRENHFLIRVGIHHRLIIEFIANKMVVAKYIIHRKDLEKTLS